MATHRAGRFGWLLGFLKNLVVVNGGVFQTMLDNQSLGLVAIRLRDVMQLVGLKTLSVIVNHGEGSLADREMRSDHNCQVMRDI